MRNHIRPLLRPLTTLPVLALLIVGAACASTGGATATGESGIRVRVENDLVPSGTVTISAVTETGARTLLGSLVAGAEQTFTYQPTVATGTYQLVADPPGPSGELVSQPIVMPESGTGSVEWHLATNNIIVQ